MVILDLMLPEVAGLDVCRAIRLESDVPIIMVTAKDSEADKVTGLELGADDYVTKPFSVRELVSRVRALLRRAGMAGADTKEDVLSGGPVQMDVSVTRCGWPAGTRAFPPKEFELLEAFLRRKGRLLTRDFLIEEVWGADYFGDTKTLDVHVKRLRKKIETTRITPSTWSRCAASATSSSTEVHPSMSTDARPIVVFLCVQNAGRSQMAAGWMRHLAGDQVEVYSGGSDPASEVNPAAIEAMAEVGIDISDQFPKPWTDEVVRAADVIVTMGCGDACPIFPGKRYLDWEVGDPAGQSVSDVRPIRDDIRDRVRGIMEELGLPSVA